MSCKHSKKVYLIERYDEGLYGDGPFVVELSVECPQCDAVLETINLLGALKDDLAYDLYNLIKSYEE